MIRINLAPPRTKEKAGAARPSSGGINLGLVFGGLAALLVVGLGGYSWKLSSDIAWFNAEIDKNQQELERLKPIIAQHQRFKEEKEELERRVNAIESVAESYDYIFVDCPPSLDILTVNALIAANSVLVPIQCEYFALEGVSELMETIRQIKRLRNPQPERSEPSADTALWVRAYGSSILPSPGRFSFVNNRNSNSGRMPSTSPTAFK